MDTLGILLFDVDGTLAETEEIHRQSFNRAFSEAGLDWVWSSELYESLLAVTGGKERIRHFIESRDPAFSAPADLDSYIADLHAAKTAIYTATVAAGRMPLRPGVRRLLSEARAAGLRLGIATTTTPANVSALLAHSLAADAEQWFDVIAAGGVVAAKKPAPDIYEYALTEMRADASQCLAFEDSGNGVRAARGAGLATLVTVSRYSRHDDFDAADLVLDHLGEPEQPATALQGDLRGHAFVDLELLNKLHAASRRQEAAG